ncbi:type IV conjugative transfer system coupling protein TraD [Pseudomonas sp. MWU13-3659]|uniref:type IV conjugative transfer system coupling protein TraD n=1 Tax=Pseudomonas sp. MWU13-3659 TaxID=2986964 RepID=UPI002076101A|nr:type IV conjugative transfer system coupling protein TraD [Pseudomonas sp. MWU13-3659]
MATYTLESLLRPPVELFTTAVCYVAAALCVGAPWAFALTPLFGIVAALGFAYLGTIRLLQARRVLRYQANLRRLPHYTMTSAEIPISNERLFIGRGFRWTQKHTQRLADTYLPQYAVYVEPTKLYERARWLEERLEFAPFPLRAIIKLTSWDSNWNPARPLPPVGGLPRLHGIEPDEQNVSLPLGERVGHSLVCGTTRVGKTRLAEVFITQDIRRTHRRGTRVHMGRRNQAPHRWSRRRRPDQQPDHEVVIVFDPKGDADLLKRMYVECKRAGRLDEFYVFHLGWPDISARYNAIGRFGRISEVATRIAGQLSGEGNSAAFREFAWRFVNIISQSLVALGRRPDYEQIRRHVINIDELFIEYAQKYFAEHDPKAWQTIVELEGKIDRKNLSFAMKDRPLRVVAIDMYLTQKRINDSVMDGLRSAVRYDKTYFDKIVASLLPLLEKLTTGRIAELLAPDYLDLADQRPIFDWMQVIRKRAVVYIGLDALSDTEVAAAVGNSMFSDLVSVAGHIYKHGIDDGLPGHMAGGKVRINLHADEFNELIGDEFIPMVNKAGGAGMQITAYTQTMSDIEAKIGSKAKAGQVIGNFNNLFMLRVRETATAELLTNQLPRVQIYNSTPASSANDSVNGKTAFTSSSHDQVQLASVPMIEPAHIVGLPKGQAFALIEGGNLWKIRMPLPANDPDDVMPSNLQELAAGMRRSAASANDWWEAPGYQSLKTALPDDLVEDFRHVATDEAA